MKTRIIKILLSTVLSVWIIYWLVSAISSVNTWDTVTATAWNEIVTKLTSINTNNDDLVTKAYVDSAVSAAGWETCYVSTPKVNVNAVACITWFTEIWTFSTATPTWTYGGWSNHWWASFTNKIARVCCK